MAESLGDRVHWHRARLRLSQRALGQGVGLSTNAISLIETGQVEPRARHLKALADVLGVSADYLLGRRETWIDDAPLADAAPPVAAAPSVPRGRRAAQEVAHGPGRP
jgi:transcriptional regulator with XRE-family HTH domain